MSQMDLSKMAVAVDPGQAMKELDGKYIGRQAGEGEMMSRLPQASMPKGQDPMPFTLGGATPSQR